MARFTLIDPNHSTGKAKLLLDGVKAKLGMTPNMARAMANSPAVLEGYLALSGALAGGALPGKLREQIALAVAEANACEYCLSAHTALGKMVGLSEHELAASRSSRSGDPKTEAALRFAHELVVRRGGLNQADVDAVRAAGYSDGEVAEIIANVAVNIFTNYFNKVAATDVDFPLVKARAA